MKRARAATGTSAEPVTIDSDSDEPLITRVIKKEKREKANKATDIPKKQKGDTLDQSHPYHGSKNEEEGPDKKRAKKTSSKSSSIKPVPAVMNKNTDGGKGAKSTNTSSCRPSSHVDKASYIAAEVDLNHRGVAGAVRLFEAGDTLPFIARYRKEATGALDEEQLRRVIK